MNFQTQRYIIKKSKEWIKSKGTAVKSPSYLTASPFMEVYVVSGLFAFLDFCHFSVSKELQ